MASSCSAFLRSRPFVVVAKGDRLLFGQGHRVGQAEKLPVPAGPTLLRLCVALVLLGAKPSQSGEWGHQGSLGLTAVAGGEYRYAIQPGATTRNGAEANLDLGGTFALSDSWSAMIEGRFSVGAPQLGLSFFGGLRTHGRARLKTFVDLNLAVHVFPAVTVGPRFAFGFQYEITQIIGIYALAGVQFGLGQGLRLSGEGMIGLQFRSYLLE